MSEIIVSKKIRGRQKGYKSFVTTSLRELNKNITNLDLPLNVSRLQLEKMGLVTKKGNTSISIETLMSPVKHTEVNLIDLDKQ